MAPSIEPYFNSPVISDSDITGNIPESYTLRVHYAKAREIKFVAGNLLLQYYSNYLFYIEVYEFHLEMEVDASFSIKEPTFFLFLMLEGLISFYDSEGKTIAEASEGICYATYNREGAYFVNSLSAGVHRFCYITPRAGWLERKAQDFSAMRNFIKAFLNSKRKYGHMPRCRINDKMEKVVAKLLWPEKRRNIELEAQIINLSIRIFRLYNGMIASGNYIHNDIYKEQIRMVRQYIEDNAKDLKTGDVQKIAEMFFFSRRTIIRVFKEETGLTMQQYIEKSKLEYALNLLKTSPLSVKEIARLSGYPDQNYFSRVFQNYFGCPPSGIRFKS